MAANGIFILKDHEERTIALDCTKNIHCESPAGAGKTALLTERLLNLLAKTDHPLHILALTFTNKAAGEMRERIWHELRRAEEGDGNASDPLYMISRKVLERHKEKLHLIYSPDGLRIMTFHSLCYAIIRSSPLEAGVSSDTTIIEGVEYDDLLSQVIDDTLLKMAGLKEGNPKRVCLENWLLRVNNNWSRLRSDFMDLIKKRDYLIDLISLVSAHQDIQSLREKINQDLGSLIAQILEQARRALYLTDLGKNWRDFAQCINQIQGVPIRSNCQGLFPEPHWASVPEWQFFAHLLTTKEGKSRKRPPKDPILKKCLSDKNAAEWARSLSEEACRILHDIRDLPVNGYDELQLQAVFDLIILLGEIMASWQEICRQKEIIDFVGLELACLKVFKNAAITDIQLILDSRISHILVDEFQDTSRNQWELLQRLCAGWTPGDGKTLFLVGDPKQSIYGFRKAEVSLFLESKNGLPIPGLGKLPLESITLKHNFRSRPGLVEWTNRIFGKTIMAHPRKDVDEVPYSPATASIEGEHRLSLSLFFQSENTSDPQEAEAKWLAHCVAKLDKAIAEEERIGVLLFARTRLSQYLRAFHETGFPVMVAEGLKLMDRIEVQCMHQMTRALVYPHDDLAYAALMRSPWFWRNPDVLCSIAAQTSPVWVDKIRHYVESSEDHEIKTWWHIFKKARIRVGRDPLFKIVKQAWINMNGAYQLAQWLGSEGVANVMQYLKILEDAETIIPEETLTKLEHNLETAYMPSPPEAARSRVAFMTVHKAKGLEFDYVFCPFLDWDPLGGGRFDQPPYLLETGRNRETLLGLRKDQREAIQDPVYKLLLTRGQEKRLAEAKRLFYVAVTRAKKGLFLSGTSVFKNGRISARCKDSPLSYIIRHEGIGEWELGDHEAERFEKTGRAGLLIQINPSIIEEKPPLTAMPSLPEPFAFHPEPIPYKIMAPSGMKAEDILFESEKDTLEANGSCLEDRARGIIIHQMLARLSKGNPLPTEKALKGALHREGIDLKEASRLAISILDEVNRCMQEKTCAWILRTDHVEAYSEWRVEDHPATHIIRSGMIDRLIFDGRRWWIVDYKTAQTDTKDQNRFIAEQARRYRAQMESYRDMVAQYKTVEQSKIVMLLYLTALQKAYDYTES